MIEIVRLSSANFQEFQILLQKSKEDLKYNLDFNVHYKDKNFLYKYLMRRSVKIIKENNKEVGFIWTNFCSLDDHLKINDMYFSGDLLTKLDENIFKILKSNSIIYEGYENTYTTNIIEKLNMKKYKETHLLKLSKNAVINADINKNVTFVNCRKKIDRRLRCFIQNEIFAEANRIPLNINDIEFDEHQEYYLEDFCYFMKLFNTVIGYGQIIYSRGIFSIVNFGIIKGYRGKGYGKLLLNKLITIARKSNIDEIYIRVEKSNLKAESLYYGCGFEYVGNISSWHYVRKADN